MKKIFNISLLLLSSLTVLGLKPFPIDDIKYFFDSSGYPKIQISAPAPNPVYDYATINYQIPENEFAEVAIFNFTGLKLKSYKISGNENSLVIDCTDLQAGVYFVSLIYQDKNVDSKKLVKK